MEKKMYTYGVIICGCVMLLSTFMIIRYFARDMQSTNEFEVLAEVVEHDRAQDDIAQMIIFDDNSKVLQDYTTLYLRNSDMVGWLKIEGTGIDYPVMQTPDEPNYYLKHSFEKQDSDYGVPYAAESCDVFLPSDNIIIHGHNMKNGKMFADLEDYKDAAFYDDHSNLRFDTLFEHGEYVILAVFETVTGADDGFAYYNFVNAANEAEFNAYISKCKELSFYETGVVAEYGDKLLTLSTCEYLTGDARLVVVAKKIPS